MYESISLHIWLQHKSSLYLDNKNQDKKIALLNILFKLSSEKKPGVGNEATILDQNSPLDFHL